MPLTVAKFVEDHITELKNLQKLGIVSSTLIANFHIYSYYKSLNPAKVPQKMNRYTFTAEAMKVSERSVMRAIKEMEKTMN